MQDISIYIDTSFHGPARKDGSYMYVLEYIRDGEPITREGVGELEKATENRLALSALAEALSRVNKPCDIRIYTGCQHIINAMSNSWARQWQKNQWRTARGEPVKNADVWEEILNQLDKHLYTFCQEQHTYSQWMQEQLKTLKAQ